MLIFCRRTPKSSRQESGKRGVDGGVKDGEQEGVHFKNQVKKEGREYPPLDPLNHPLFTPLLHPLFNKNIYIYQ